MARLQSGLAAGCFDEEGPPDLSASTQSDDTGLASRPAGMRKSSLLVFLPNLTLLLLLILAWQFASTVWLPSIDPHMAVLMPAPTTIARTATSLVVSGELFFHLAASLKREASAFVVA